MATRLASSRLIGRSEELADLEGALRDAGDGRPSVAFVAGDSGIGKTRLLDELARRARDDGALVLIGECADFGDASELPYLPLVAALRPLARAPEPALAGPLRDAVAPLLSGAGAPLEADADALGAQARVFEALLALLDTLGRARPVLLVLEDLHWADRSTRAALAFLGSSLTVERVLVVGSYRSDELARGHPLRQVIADLERRPRSRRVALEPLTRDELAEQLADILGARPDAELLDRLWARSAGNPLFGEELLAAGLDGLGAPPGTLRDALMVRVERLPAASQAVLRVVAVAGRVEHPVLEQAAGSASPALRDALRGAVDAHILAVQDDGQYRFRHALLREVVEADLLPGERADLHLAVARALEDRLQGSTDARATAAVAHHFAAAGDRPAALAAAVRAAEAAEHAHAYGEAAALHERALELWQAVPDAAERAGVDRVALLERAAAAASAVGDPGRQLALLEEAFAALGGRPDPRRAAVILESTARAHRHLGRAQDSIATLEQALALVGERGDRALRAHVLAGLARALLLVGRHEDAALMARRALEAANDQPLVEGSARNTLGVASAMAGDVDAGAVELREAIRVAREHDALNDLAVAYDNYSSVLHALGRTAEARELAAEGRRAVAGKHPIGTMWLDVQRARLAFDAGDWAEAEAVLPAATPATGAQTRVAILLCRAALAEGRGEDVAARQLIDELAALTSGSTDPQALGPAGVLRAERHRRAGELDAARAVVAEALEGIVRMGQDPIAPAAVAAAGVTVESDVAQRARDLGDAAAETAALRRADELIERLRPLATPARPVERAMLLGARAERSRGAGRPDGTLYAQAAKAWDALGRPEPAALMRWREAEARVAAADREGATAPARAAHASARRLGAGWLRAEIERLAARARLKLAPGDVPAPPAADDPFGLTVRERQVLALLAEGVTNREIGATLFMAEKTASVHVSRILAKLGARSRTEAAAIALRHGLASFTRPG